MRRAPTGRAWVVACALLTACSGSSFPTSLDGSDLPPHGSIIPPDRLAPTCRAPKRVVRERVKLKQVTAPRSFDFPVNLHWTPAHPERLYVLEITGRVVSIEPRALTTTRREVLDLSDRILPIKGEMGAWGFTFHPDYPTTPHAYVFYTGHGGSTGFRSVLSRFTSRDGGETLAADSEEQLLVLERLPEGIHAGGHIAFGADGYLYLSTGDGQEFGDPRGNAQNPHSLFGKMLRLDVDGGFPYAIPTDNPNAQGGGAPEVYARGFRNPYRWSFDAPTGELWLGDVGHVQFEEVNKVVRGGNYGWNIKEGNVCFAINPCDSPATIKPVVAYGRDVGVTVIGGFVYRGRAIPELIGRYVYGDFSNGTLWVLGQDGPELLSYTGSSIVAFGQDGEGELYVLDVAAGQILQIVPSDGSDGTGASRLLSVTGCLNDPGLIPYQVKSALWSDGLEKQRWMAIPLGAKIEVLDDGNWEMPPGTVLVKSFLDQGRPIETRLLARDEEGAWFGVTYEWDSEGQDASLVEGARVKDLGGGHSWRFPSRSDCMSCHTAAARHSLGLETAQLDDGIQLEYLDALGLLEGPVVHSGRLVGLEDDASLSSRARSYLHANCAGCHRPAGPGDRLDLRLQVPLGETGICDRFPSLDLGIPNARILAPGDPDRSVLLRRISVQDGYRMPPLGSQRVDQTAVALLRDWISGLTSCEE